jgi:PAN domain
MNQTPPDISPIPLVVTRAYKWTCVLVLIALIFFGFKKIVVRPKFIPTFEINMMQNGTNYRQFAISSNDPEDCMRICLDEDECQAWNYSKPGVTGPNGYCWLKHDALPGIYEVNFISGVARE